MGRIKLSIIVPLFNEEESVSHLCEKIARAIDPLGLTYEVVLVDDGSKDASFAIAKTIAQEDSRIRVVKLRKNYGQTPAMVAGIEHARGDVLVTMDGDLQNDPYDIPRFLEKIEEGYDIVCGWRHKRQDRLISRKIPSKIANWIIGKITGVPIKDNGCSLKAYRAHIIQSVPLYSDMHRFIPAMTSLAGTNIAEIKVNHLPRRFGVSKYGISRVYKVFIDLLVIKTLISFSTRPLRFFVAGGLISMMIGIILLSSSIAGLYSQKGEFGFMVAASALLFFILSCFLVMIGLLCELAYKAGDSKTLSSLKRSIE